MVTLYRKYRPQTFSEVVGQNHIKTTLQHEIAQNKIAHAYLFCGPRAVGKTTLARVFAKAINCPKRQAGEFEPCNTCQTCAEITSGRSLDMMEIDAASHTSVDNVRNDIIANARIAPVSSKYKVFIIDEVHMLSSSAFNALLKIMEEPPAYVVFILCTTEIHKVPNTIISRCQRFDFKRISLNEIANRLNVIANKEGIKIDYQILELIARQSEGHMRDAESLLGQVVAIGGKEITSEEADLVIPRSNLSEAVKLVDLLSRKDAGEAIFLINNLVDNGINLKVFVSDLIEILRKILIAKINPALSEKLGMEFGENLEMEINRIAASLNTIQTLNFIEKFLAARNELKGSFIIQLPLEMAVAEICSESAVKSENIVTRSTKAGPSSTGNQPAIKDSSPPQNIPKTLPGGFNIELITGKWHEVLAKVKSHNHSLSFIMRACQPVKLNGNQLSLAFKYKFHKDRIGDINIRRIVEKILQEVYCAPLVFEAVIDESIDVPGNGSNGDGASLANEPSPPMDKNVEEKPKSENDDMINNLLKTFGGKIVS